LILWNSKRNERCLLEAIMKRWILTASGKDRPGIVAGVTQALYKLGCNLEDSAMTRLGGEFAIILIFSGPSKIAEEHLERVVAPLAKTLRLVIHLKGLPAAKAAASRKQSQPYVISVYGADRAGIVYRISDALSKEGINITDVETRRSGAGSGRKAAQLYLLLLEVELPARVTAEALEKRLFRIGQKLGVEVSIHSAEASVL